MNNISDCKFNLFVFIFVLAPLYCQANLGGSGLELPYNIVVWIGAIFVLFYSISKFILNKQFVYPNFIVLLLSFPFTIIAIALFSTDDYNHATWLFRLVFICGGALFFIALFQLKLKQIEHEKILLLIVFSCFCQAVIGVLQVWIVAIPYFPDSGVVPSGIFQQINVQATFQATGILVALYLISLPSFNKWSFASRGVLLLAFFCMLYVILLSGSRIGLLSICLTIPALITLRYKYLLKEKYFISLLFIVVIVAICLSQVTPEGLEGVIGTQGAIDKTFKLIKEDYSNARIAIYTICVHLIEKQFFTGYGLGSFLSVWDTEASQFVLRNPETSLPATINHPHNEFLFWAIEGGMLSVFSLVLVLLATVLTIKKMGTTGFAYGLMLLPITMHTQVELPFYISSLHWFTWLFLLYLVFNHKVHCIYFSLSKSMSKLMIVSTGLFSSVAIAFLINTAFAQNDIYNFVKGINTGDSPLKTALNNLYTQNYAEQLAMRSMLYASIQNEDIKKVETFEAWAMNYVKKSPELKMYEDLISASMFLRPEGKGCDAITAGLAMYAHNEPLQNAVKDCRAQ